MPLSKPFAFLGSSAAGLEPVTDGLTFHVSAHDSTSYPGSGTTWYDISGTGRDFTLVGSPTYNSNESFTFNGSSQYAEYNPGSHEWWDYSNEPDFTLEYVFKYDQFGDSGIFGTMFSQWGNTTGDQTFLNQAYGSSGGQLASIIRNNATTYTFFTNLNTTYGNTNWIHAVYRYTYDSGTGDYTINITLNDNLTATQTWTTYTAFNPSSAATNIARRAKGDSYFDGDIGVVRVYGATALTDAEITQNFEFESQYYTFI